MEEPPREPPAVAVNAGIAKKAVQSLVNCFHSSIMSTQSYMLLSTLIGITIWSCRLWKGPVGSTSGAN